MSEQTYDVILEGICRPGTYFDEVKANMARLFKLQPDKVDTLLKGKPAIIKKGLNLALARKYKGAIEKAGAACKLRPLLSETVPLQPDTVERTVLDIKTCNESALYSPLTIPFVSSHPEGLDFNRNDNGPMTFGDLQQVCLFTEKKGKKLGYRILFFVQGSKRPYLADAAKIRYNQFVEGDTVTVPESARKFVLFLLKNNSRIAVDANTHAFLNGGRFFEIDAVNLLAYITSLGEAMKVDTQAPAIPKAPSDIGIPSATQPLASPVAPSPVPVQPAAPPRDRHASSGVSGEMAPLSVNPRNSSSGRKQEKPAMASEKVQEARVPGKPEIDIEPFSWTELLSVSFFAGLLVMLIVGLWKAPNMLYDFLTSRIKINGRPLRFDDNLIWVRLLPFTMAPSVFAFWSIILDMSGYHRGPLQDLTLTMFLVCLFCASLIVPVLFTQAFLTHTRLAGKTRAFKPLYEGNMLGVFSYIKNHVGEYLTLFFAGLLIQSLILAPCGFALMVKIYMARLRVDGYSYTFEIPWFHAFIWCLFGYLTVFLGLFRYWAILYEDILPTGKWVKADK